jgi:alpha-glucosidase
MFFTKYPHPANFTFASDLNLATGDFKAGDEDFRLLLTSYEGGIFHLQVTSDRWAPNSCIEPLELPTEAQSQLLELKKGFGLQLKRGKSQLLAGSAGATFGVSGEASMFRLSVPEDARFYGMGEKYFGQVELSGMRTKFWNTDVWGDFHHAQWLDHAADPPYFSTPYVVCKLRDEYVGLLLHNPHPTWISTPGTDESRIFVEWQRTDRELILGSESGEPNLWIITGPTLRDVTTKLQRLVGVTPLPPMWSLGYHQSRWGYGGEKDLLELDSKFEELGIPCDGLWLDLDYMDGFRVFRTSKTMFPKGAAKTAAKLAKNRRRIVPILDPGVKQEPGNPVYDSGRKAGVFCKNPEGGEFVGLVWPGQTVFPDFTTEKGRDWWTGYVQGFADEGFGATWLDMNDPSTGPVDPNGMLFRDGAEPHAWHRNQYALGMQRASFDGFRKARPNERPFMLSRSGFIGSSKYAAIWTGDNLSNRFYLANSITAAIGMSLSGLPFAGPDLGGFGGDADDALMVDWIKAGFLFPFCRNHSMKGSKEQEPWRFSPKALVVIRHYIQLRYKMLPYLYNLFARQEEIGEPILRPLFFEFEDAGLDTIDDQFLIGPHVLQAPHIKEGRTRTVTLPGTEQWFDASSGVWLAPGTQEIPRSAGATPLFFRDAALIPMQPGLPERNEIDLLRPEIHLFLHEDSEAEASLRYVADDGLSYGYRNGQRSEMLVRARNVNGAIEVEVEHTECGFGAIEAVLVVHGRTSRVIVNGLERSGERGRVKLTGRELKTSLVSLPVCGGKN